MMIESRNGPAVVLPQRNALYSASQVLVTTVVAFGTYAIVSRSLGLQVLGLWSVTVALCAFVSVADLGIGGSMVRFIAVYRAAGDHARARVTAVTALGSVGVMTAAVASVGFLLGAHAIGRVIPAHEISIARQLLPFALITASINAISETVLGGLEGCEQYKQRATSVVAGSLTLVTVLALGLPRLGDVGIGVAFVAQSVVVLTCGTLFLGRALGLRGHVGRLLQLETLHPLLAMGWRLKLISFANLLLDPVTKLLVLKVGGSEMSGLFEIASRLPAQLRALLVASMQVTVPRFASLSGRANTELYRKIVELAFIGGTTAFTALILALPLLSVVLLGRFDSTFVLFASVLGLSWFVNVLSAPAYFAFIGMGELRWNLIGHVTMGLVNAILGYFGGVVAGAVGVVSGACVAIAIGSLVHTVAFGLARGEWPLPRRRADWLAGLVCLVLVVAWHSTMKGDGDEAFQAWLSGGAAVTFALLASGYLIHHPVFDELRGRRRRNGDGGRELER
jgi:O-antigen/teichoic acid export membrane protein